MTTFGAIYADPMWRYEVWSRDTGLGRSAESHYPTSPLADMLTLRVADLAAPNCCLFMWATWPTILDAFQLGAAWGFTYKTCAFLWTKTNKSAVDRWVTVDEPANWFVGMGYWSRANTEPCLLFTRGKPKRKAKNVRQLVVAPIGQHSQKPALVHERIEALVDGPYLELFGREAYSGWTVMGNEIDGQDIREALRCMAVKETS